MGSGLIVDRESVKKNKVGFRAALLYHESEKTKVGFRAALLYRRGPSADQDLQIRQLKAFKRPDDANPIQHSIASSHGAHQNPRFRLSVPVQAFSGRHYCDGGAH